MAYSPGLNREKNIECYIGLNTNSISNPESTKLTYCEIIGDRLINIWVNREI